MENVVLVVHSWYWRKLVPLLLFVELTVVLNSSVTPLVSLHTWFPLLAKSELVVSSAGPLWVQLQGEQQKYAEFFGFSSEKCRETRAQREEKISLLFPSFSNFC